MYNIETILGLFGLIGQLTAILRKEEENGFSS
jgi:hypothetical protein